MDNRLKHIVILALILLAGWFGQLIITGGASKVSLASAPPLSGDISQSLVSSSENFLPKLNVDYKIDNISTIDNSAWAIAKISLTGQNTSASFVLLQEVSGAYRVVLGPGTAFSISSGSGIPPEVIKGLESAGAVIYSPLGSGQ